MKRIPEKIWDLPTRITHWALALCVILNLFILEEGEIQHEWTGYISVGLVAFRFVWGFFGAEHSRFRSFPVSPSTISSFVKGGLRADTFGGHNPFAALTYIAMWTLILALGVSGYLMEHVDYFWGEEWIENLHANLALGVQILIGFHLIGLTVDSFRYKRKTWMGMFNGRR